MQIEYICILNEHLPNNVKYISKGYEFILGTSYWISMT